MTPPTAKSASSPRTWGCFSRGACIARLVLVFPTHVGVFLPAKSGRRSETWSSPRTWGCFFHCSTSRDISAVFPTHVGVFPGPSGCGQANAGLPHARGGVSYFGSLSEEASMSSPRTWGCFCFVDSLFGQVSVFPTHVGVFLEHDIGFPIVACLPHARGGVSRSTSEKATGVQSSPRTWGCFRGIVPCRISLWVFPAHVGVFLRAFCPRSPSPRLPHARGGVSQTADTVGFRPLSSLSTWGISKKLLIAVY